MERTKNGASNATDHQLLLCTARGDDAAAAELWSRVGRELCAYAAAMLRVPGADASDPMALDAVQSVFLRVMKMDGSALKRVEHVRAWLTGAVRNVVLNRIRADHRQASLERRVARGESRDGAEGGTRLAGLEVLLAALDRLPEDARELVLLKHVANLTVDEMARSLDANRNTVASRLRTAMEQLREVLGEMSAARSSAASAARAPSGAAVGLGTRDREVES